MNDRSSHRVTVAPTHPNAIERWQWQGGNKLEIVALTTVAYRDWISQLFGDDAPKYSDFREWLSTYIPFRSKPIYFAKHWTGWDMEILSLRIPFPRLAMRYTVATPMMKLVINKHGWWVGTHVAEPIQNMYVMTPAVGTIDMLRPPKISRRWARRVESFDSPVAKAWSAK